MEKFNIKDYEVKNAIALCLYYQDEDHYEIKNNWFLKYIEGDNFLHGCFILERKAHEDYEVYNNYRDFEIFHYINHYVDFLEKNILSDIVNDIMQYIEEYYKNYLPEKN